MANRFTNGRPKIIHWPHPFSSTIGLLDWIKVLHPTRHKSRSFQRRFPNQSLGHTYHWTPTGRGHWYLYVTSLMPAWNKNRGLVDLCQFQWPDSFPDRSSFLDSLVTAQLFQRRLPSGHPDIHFYELYVKNLALEAARLHGVVRCWRGKASGKSHTRTHRRNSLSVTYRDTATDVTATFSLVGHIRMQRHRCPTNHTSTWIHCVSKKCPTFDLL